MVKIGHEDDDTNPHFLKKDNGPDYEMDENVDQVEPADADMTVDVDMTENEAEESDRGHKKTTCSQVERPPKIIIRKKKYLRQIQESVNMEGAGQDNVMVDEGDQDVRVNEDEVYGGNVGQSIRRKKSKGILKMKVAKKVKGEGSSASKAMKLD
ncbi:unnamed protein product [Lactuca virosa]|uniref:Uncharacterized protein n=1 Tax=Lactuca virosa TaxID=75947 RepID=A0AAU9MVU2_9ASTR|nr:unnamed protein product [Lactuca virosa]